MMCRRRRPISSIENSTISNFNTMEPVAHGTLVKSQETTVGKLVVLKVAITKQTLEKNLFRETVAPVATEEK